MSIQLIQKYYTELDKVIRYSGSQNETSLRNPFQDLLEQGMDFKTLQKEKAQRPTIAEKFKRIVQSMVPFLSPKGDFKSVCAMLPL